MKKIKLDRLHKQFLLEKRVITAAERYAQSVKTPLVMSPMDASAKLIFAVKRLNQFEKEGKR